MIGILGDVGPFAILGEVILWALKELGEAAEHYAKEDLKQGRTLPPEPAYPDLSLSGIVQERPDVTKVMGFLARFDRKELDDRILRALRHSHQRPRVGACYYTWLKGTDSQDVLNEPESIVTTAPQDKIALAALAKLTG